ncbi:hypothetical protein F1188_01125 [Roseospira marina]|uniref:Uncharacterized protein n=1 Tax=Roseospira marina TaxID=140057 RepID=A0A5M6IHH3_9PROT|nr:hypothetical protein [Roseospira marina]KAA5607397.1 hypothetical protein F1188_01125 [Roseospira marina]MBB4312431.1 hypothetical protein [Roseospira marina]MBB5085553.1 hypothetical protein [Roseospira marina]
MTAIKERGQFVLVDGSALASAANADAGAIARFSGLSEKAVATVLAGRKTTWVRCAKVVRALRDMGARDASLDAIARQGD